MSTVTRETFASRGIASRRRGYLILPCGPDRGCDDDGCEGWADIPDNPISLRHWTADEISEARAF